MFILKKDPKEKKLSLIGFLQASGLLLYCSLIGVLFWKGNKIFGPMNNYLGPVMFLVLFVVSALICALIGLGYPLILFWDQKKTKSAIRLVGYTSLWLVFYFLLIFLILLIF